MVLRDWKYDRTVTKSKSGLSLTSYMLVKMRNNA